MSPAAALGPGAWPHQPLSSCRGFARTAGYEDLSVAGASPRKPSPVPSVFRRLGSPKAVLHLISDAAEKRLSGQREVNLEHNQKRHPQPLGGCAALCPGLASLWKHEPQPSPGAPHTALPEAPSAPLHFRGDPRAGVQPSRPLEAQALPPDQYILKPAIPPAAHPAFWGPWPPEADLERRARGPQQPLGPARGAARRQEARETPQCQAELGPRSSGMS